MCPRIATAQGGTITPGQSGETVYYTLDGSAPVAGNGTLCTQPFLVAATAAVNAVGYVAGEAPSDTICAAYTITAGSGTPPSVAITSPVASVSEGSGMSSVQAAVITGPTAITGTVTGDSTTMWEIDYQYVGTSTWVCAGAGSGAGSVSANLDTTLLLNGEYTLRLWAVSDTGAASPAEATVRVKGDQKVGYFTLSYTDMTIPVAGIPISITRTYDSRNKSSGDFGIGWTMSTQNITLQESGSMSENWEAAGDELGSVAWSSAAHTVGITLPNGDAYNFDVEITDTGGYADGLYGYIAYNPYAGTHATLTCLNEQSLVTFSGSNTEIEDQNLEPYTPTSYLLTLANGTRYTLNTSDNGQTWQLYSVTDLNGNTVTFTPTSITSNSGRGITMTRSGGYITGITDPLGNTISYTQDGTGNLASFTDRDGNASTYDYDPTHLLTGIHDAQGDEPLQNTYDGTGRLISTTDATGKQITYTYNLPANTTTVTDRLGNVTTLVYDSYGNVTSKTQYLNGLPVTTTSTFNVNDPNNPNKPMTVTDPLGRTTYYTYNATGQTLTTAQDHSYPDPDNPGHMLTSVLATSNTYNAYGQPVTVTDPMGVLTTTNTYDPSTGNLTKVTDALGRSTTFSYNTNGTPATSTDAAGQTTHYGYDSAGDLTSVTDALGHITQIGYNVDGQKTSTTTTRTNPLTQATETLTTTYAYDGNGNVTATTAPDGSVSQSIYNDLGKLGSTIDAAGRTTAYQYNSLGQLTQTSYPDGTTTSTTYDANGNVIASTDKSGRISGNVYDPLGRVVQTGLLVASNPFTGTTANFQTDASGNPIYSGTTFDLDGEVIATRDANGNSSGTSYDDLGRELTSTDAYNKTTTYAYDNDGRQISVTDANTNTTQSTYDAGGELTTTTYANGSTTVTGYDSLGRRISAADQSGRATDYGYDSLGRLVTVTDPMSEVTKFGYDELGEKVSQTDANGHVTEFAYDLCGRLVEKILPAGQYQLTTYNADGSMNTQTSYVTGPTDPSAFTTYFAYDSAGRPTGTRDASGDPLTGTVYNSDSTVRSTTKYAAPGQQAQTVTTAYTYDAATGRLASVTTTTGTGSGAITNTVSYTYDDAGNKLTATTPSATTGYTYDNDERTSTVTTTPSGGAAETIATYAYDNVGNRASLIRDNGITTTYAYDTLNRLTDQSNTGPSGTISNYAYTLLPDGKRAGFTETGSAVGAGITNATSYTYDAAGRLVEEAGPGPIDIRYTYDAVGNRVAKTTPEGDTEYHYDNDDRLTATQYTPTGGQAQPALMYSYDPSGDETSDGTNAYAYDAAHEMISATTPTGTESYSYNADGIRVQTVSANANGATMTNNVLDGSLPYASIAEERDGSNNLVARYDYGDDLVRMDSSTGVYYYLYDGLGSTRQLTDSTGNVTDAYSYDAFGEVTRLSGSTPNPFLFNGQQMDATGLYYLRARYMSPADGRFLSQDPYEGTNEDPAGLHRYLYAGDEPVTMEDPGGRDLGEVLAAIGIASTIAGTVLPVFTICAPANAPTLDNPAVYPDYTQSGGYILLDIGSTVVGGAVGKIAAAFVGTVASAIFKRVFSQGAKSTEEFISDGLQARQALQIGSRRNMAVARWNIGGDQGNLVSASGPSPAGTAGLPDNPMFKTKSVGGWDRTTDAERKLLETLAKAIKKPNAYGHVELYTQLKPCSSCEEVIDQFRKAFPNIKVDVYYGGNN